MICLVVFWVTMQLGFWRDWLLTFCEKVGWCYLQKTYINLYVNYLRLTWVYRYPDS